MKPKKILTLVIASSLAIFIGCRPKGAEYIDELDVVGTAYAKDANFSNKSTYYISDTIPEVDGDDSNKQEYLNSSTSNLIVSQIDKNMKAYGWTKATNPFDADMIMQVAGMKTTNVYYYYSYYYYGYYGWYYPGYYPPTYTTTQSGTILMQLVDRKDVSISGKAPVLWVGIINGLMEGSSSSVTSRIASTIDQAFKQSPILKK